MIDFLPVASKIFSVIEPRRALRTFVASKMIRYVTSLVVTAILSAHDTIRESKSKETYLSADRLLHRFPQFGCSQTKIEDAELPAELTDLDLLWLLLPLTDRDRARPDIDGEPDFDERRAFSSRCWTSPTLCASMTKR